jgi:hypothetical protein
MKQSQGTAGYSYAGKDKLSDIADQWDILRTSIPVPPTLASQTEGRLCICTSIVKDIVCMCLHCQDNGQTGDSEIKGDPHQPNSRLNYKATAPTVAAGQPPRSDP